MQYNDPGALSSSASTRQFVGSMAEGLPFVHDLPLLDSSFNWSSIVSSRAGNQAVARPVTPVFAASVSAGSAANIAAPGPQPGFAAATAALLPPAPVEQLLSQLQTQQPRHGSHIFTQLPPAGVSGLGPSAGAVRLTAAAVAEPVSARPTALERPCWPWYGTFPPASPLGSRGPAEQLARGTPGPQLRSGLLALPQPQLPGVATGAAAASAGAAAQLSVGALGGAARDAPAMERGAGTGLHAFAGVANWEIDEHLLAEIARTPWPSPPAQESNLNPYVIYGRTSATMLGGFLGGDPCVLPGLLPYMGAAAVQAQELPPVPRRPSADAAQSTPVDALSVCAPQLSQPPLLQQPQQWQQQQPAQPQVGLGVQSAQWMQQEESLAAMMSLSVPDVLPYRSASAMTLMTGRVETGAGAALVRACERQLHSLQMRSPRAGVWSVSSCGLGDDTALASPFTWHAASAYAASSEAGVAAMLPLSTTTAPPSLPSDPSTFGRPAADSVSAAAAYAANSYGGSGVSGGNGDEWCYGAALVDGLGGGNNAGAGSTVGAMAANVVQGQGQGQDRAMRDVRIEEPSDVITGPSPPLEKAHQGMCGAGGVSPVLALACVGAASSSAPPRSRLKTKTGSKSSSGGGGTGSNSGSDTGGSGQAAGDTRAAFLAMLRSSYDLPVAVAARALGVSVTELKRRCRAVGIQRWPSRKLQSLDRILSSTQEDEELTHQQRQDISTAVVRNRLEILEDPNAPIVTDLKVVRQVQYKQLHDRRHKPGATGKGRSSAASS